MNKFYYPKILFDNIDKLFIGANNNILFYSLVISFVIGAVVFPIVTYLNKNKGLKNSVYFNFALVFICMVISLSLVWFLSIPLLMIVVQMITFLYNIENETDKVNKGTIKVITFGFVCFIAVINFFIRCVL